MWRDAYLSRRGDTPCTLAPSWRFRSLPVVPSLQHLCWPACLNYPRPGGGLPAHPAGRIYLVSIRFDSIRLDIPKTMNLFTQLTQLFSSKAKETTMKLCEH